MIIGIIGVNPETERVVDFIRGYWPGTVVASIDELEEAARSGRPVVVPVVSDLQGARLIVRAGGVLIGFTETALIHPLLRFADYKIPESDVSDPFRIAQALGPIVYDADGVLFRLRKLDPQYSEIAGRLERLEHSPKVVAVSVPQIGGGLPVYRKWVESLPDERPDPLESPDMGTVWSSAREESQRLREMMAGGQLTSFSVRCGEWTELNPVDRANMLRDDIAPDLHKRAMIQAAQHGFRDPKHDMDAHLMALSASQGVPKHDVDYRKLEAHMTEFDRPAGFKKEHEAPYDVATPEQGVFISELKDGHGARVTRKATPEEVEQCRYPLKGFEESAPRLRLKRSDIASWDAEWRRAVAAEQQSDDAA